MALARGARVVRFFAPSIRHYESTEFPATACVCDFVAVSVTGASCALGCDHCGGVLLRSMHEARTPDGLLDLAGRLASRGCRGLLVSGGSDRDGTVPLSPFTDAIAEVRARHGMQVAVHTGLVPETLAAGLARAGVDCAMLDVVGSGETLKSVYHLDAGPAAIDDSLGRLREHGLRIVPHVVAGLHNGSIVGERAAIEMAARDFPAALVLIVLMPLAGTPMQGATPPGPADVASLIGHARSVLPATAQVLLGCARPGGSYRVELDRLALDAGVDGIAFPAEGTVDRARRMGMGVSFHHACCSMPIPASTVCESPR